jgi:hypothetical protein
VKKGERELKSSDGSESLERRRHLRLSIDLPIEYTRRDLVVRQNRANNGSEGGLLAHFAEPMKVGKWLRIKLFFPARSVFNVSVVWSNHH